MQIKKKKIKSMSLQVYNQFTEIKTVRVRLTLVKLGTFSGKEWDQQDTMQIKKKRLKVQVYKCKTSLQRLRD